MRRERVGAEVYVFKIQQWVVVEGNWQLNLRLLVTLSMALVRIRDVILLFLHYVPRFASLCCTGAVDSGRNINGATLDFPTWLFLLNLIPQAPKQCAAPHARHLRCGVTESAAVPGIHANGLVHKMEQALESRSIGTFPQDFCSSAAESHGSSTLPPVASVSCQQLHCTWTSLPGWTSRHHEGASPDLSQIGRT